MASNSLHPLARTEGLVVQELPDEVLVYDLATNMAHCLNSSAALIWRNCDGTKTISDMSQEFLLTNGSSVSEAFIWLGIEQLAESRLLETDPVYPVGRRSRRDIVKALGMASVISLPIISSLAAPNTAIASSSACACTTNATCTQPSRAVCGFFTCNANGICGP